MAITLASLQRSSVLKAPRMLMYGTAGIGKTTFGTCAPNPVFIQTEDTQIDVPTFGILRTYAEVMEALASLYQEPHDFQTAVLDSVDWLEPLVWAEACSINQWANIEAAGYGKGYAAALDVWRVVLDGFNALRDERGMTIIFLGHSEIKRFDSPETEPYDRYQPKLNKGASALVQEHVDCVLFANYRVSTVKSDVGFNRKAVRGVGGSDRLIHTTERPAYLAKNRYGLPDTLPLDWNALASAIPFYNMAKPAENVGNAPTDNAAKE